MAAPSPRASSALHTLFVLSVAGCGASHGGAATATREPTHEPALYTIHEWGVVRAEAGDQLRVSASAPQRAAEYFFDPGAVVEKPVLYFHVAGDTTVALRSLRITVDDRIVEHWPHTGPLASPSTLAWNDWTILREHCVATRYPSASEAPCDALGAGECEAEGLRAHETESSGCLEREGERANMLFYRSSTRVAPPIVLRREGGSLRVTHASDDAMPDTLIVRVRGAAASMLAAPPPHGTVELAEPTGSVADAVTALRAETARRGLDAEEVAAFWRAWEGTLVGDPQRPLPAVTAEVPPAEDEAEEALPRERAHGELPPPSPADRVFYFLPRATIDAMSRLEADPPPSELVRVFAVIQAVPEG